MSSLNSDEYSKVIDKLIAARKKVNLTQIAAAKKLGKPQSYLSKIENCQRRVDIIELKKIAEIFNVNISDLL